MSLLDGAFLVEDSSKGTLRHQYDQILTAAFDIGLEGDSYYLVGDVSD